MSVVVRHYIDDFYTVIACQAIEDAGGTVISVVYAGGSAPLPGMTEGTPWRVFFRTEDITTTDEAIEAKFKEY
ncbi:MAG: hypothetical protein ACYTBJ_02475 [Planctomycetota bacterium]|jgi:hypothetical protein